MLSRASAGPLRPHGLQHRVAHVAADHHDDEDPAPEGGEVSVGQVVPQAVVGGVHRLAGEGELEHSLPGEEQGQGDHEARDADLGDQVAVEHADRGTDADRRDQRGDQVLGQVGHDQHQADRHHHGAGPGLEPHRERDGQDHADEEAPVHQGGQARVQVTLEDGDGGDGGTGAPRGAGRQVDLAEQQHEHEAQGDDGDVGALAGQVAEVVGGQELVGDLREDQREDDQAQHRRQRARVTGADLADPAGEGITDRAFLDVEGELAPVRGRRLLGTCGGLRG